jgi:3-oxoacyl-[acyl-carrier-protein] synthase III
MSHIGLAATAAYLPERWMAAAEIAEASGIPEQVIVEKFGLRGKHIAAADEHVSDMSVAAGRALLEEHDVDPEAIDALVYFGSTWREYPVWLAAPWIAHRLGCTRAFSLEYANVSCGTPVAMRACKNLMVAEPRVRTILAVAASRESHLLDYANERSRFMFNFGDGAVAGLIVNDHPPNELLGSHAITDGSLSLHVKVPGGGSVDPANGYRFLDVDDPQAMKLRLDDVSMENFRAAAEGALADSGATLADLTFLCGIHMKRSMHDAVLADFGLDAPRAVYLDDTGHMSGVDPLLALDRAVRGGKLRDGDLVLLLAAGTGYTWAATALRWGQPSSS